MCIKQYSRPWEIIDPLVSKQPEENSEKFQETFQQRKIQEKISEQRNF